MPERQLPIRPFPEVARFPDEPPLDGAPASAAESIFLSIPELGRAANAASQHGELNSDARRRFLEQRAAELMTDPQRCVQFLDALAVLQAAAPSAQLTNFSGELATALDRVHLDIKTFSSERLHDWIELSVESAIYRPLAERILKRAIEHCPDTASITKLLYNLALGGLASSNPRVAERAMEILSYQSELLPANSVQALNYLLASFDLNDDVLQRAMEIDGALTFLCKIHRPELFEKKQDAHDQIAETALFKKGTTKIFRADPKRLKALHKFYGQSSSDLGVLQFNEDTHTDLTQWPWPLVLQGGPLRRWFNDRMAPELSQRENQERISLHLPERDIVVGPPVGHMIQKQLESPTATPRVLTEAPYWKTLAYLTPDDLSVEDCTRLRDWNAQLREEMQTNTRHLLSPRGDRLEIRDDLLTALGIKEVLFAMHDQNKRETIVTLTIGRYHFQALLDEYFSLNMVLPQMGEFLLSVILSHLHAIRCSDTVTEIGGPSSSKRKPETVGEKRTSATARRAHRRHLPPGQHPTPDQISRVLKEYEIDLVRMNREAEARGETSQITFVTEIEEAAESAGSHEPIRSRAPLAATQLRKKLEHSTN